MFRKNNHFLNSESLWDGVFGDRDASSMEQLKKHGVVFTGEKIQYVGGGKRKSCHDNARKFVKKNNKAKLFYGRCKGPIFDGYEGYENRYSGNHSFPVVEMRVYEVTPDYRLANYYVGVPIKEKYLSDLRYDDLPLKKVVDKKWIRENMGR